MHQNISAVVITLYIPEPAKAKHYFRKLKNYFRDVVVDISLFV